MCKRFVCFGHLVGIFTLLNGSAGTIGSIHDFAGYAFAHGSFTTEACIIYQPADTQGGFAVCANFYRNLVVRTAHAPRPYFQQGHYVLHSGIKNFQRILTRFGTDYVKCIIYDAFSNAFLTVQHYFINKSG